MKKIYILSLVMLTFFINSMDNNLVSSNNETLIEVLHKRRDLKDMGNPRNNIVYSYSEGQLDKKKIYEQLESYAKQCKIKNHLIVLSYCGEATFKIEFFDTKAQKWETALFLNKGINDDHFLSYVRDNRSIIGDSAVCLLAKIPDDITLGWKAIEHLKIASVPCVYVTDDNVQYDFKKSDAFACARKPIEKVIVQSRSMFGPEVLDMLVKCTAIVGVFFVPCIMFYKIAALFAK